MNIMLGRVSNLKSTYDALMSTGYYLLAKTHIGLTSIVHISADDVGIYYFIPLLMKTFSLSLSVAINYFFYGMLGIGLFMLFLSIFLLSNMWVVIYSGMSFFLLNREGFFRLTDTYIVSIFCTFTLIPFSLWLLKNVKKVVWYYYVWMFFVGIIIGYSHYIRLYSSMPVLFFISIFIIFLSNIAQKYKIILFLFLFSGLSVPVFHFNLQVRKAQDYLKKHSSIQSNVPYRHLFWHNIYAGFGYVQTHLNITYSDACSKKTAQKLCPGVERYSLEYEKVLRNEVLRIMCKERFTFASILFAKCGVVLLFILACANIGLIAAYYYPKGIVEYLFWGSMGLASLPGLLVSPRASYLSGLAAFAFVYGIYSLIIAFQTYKKNLRVKKGKK